MQLLKPQHSHEPALAGTLDDLVSDIKFIPFTCRLPDVYPGWSSLSGDTNEGWSYAQSGWFRVKLQPVMLEVLSYVGTIYEKSLKNFSDQHYLEISRFRERGTFLYLRFQQILGYRCLMQLDDDDAFGWLNRARKYGSA